MANREYVHRRKEFFLLIIPLFILEFVRGAFVISYLPNLSINALGISVTVVGLAVSIHFISDAATNLAVGYIMERLGTNLVIHLSFLISMVGLTITSVSINNLTVVLGSLLLGTGISPLWLVMLTKAGGERRGQNISLVYLGWLIGIGTGTIIMNYLFPLNNRFVLWLLPILIGFGWIIYSIVSREPVSYRQSSLKKQWKATLELLESSKVIMPGILLQGIAMGMLIPILPLFAKNQLDLTSNQYSLLMVTGGLSAVLFLVPLGKVVDRSNKVLLFIIGFSSLAVSLFILAISPNLIITITCVILMGMFYALLLPAWNSFVAGFIPESLKEASWGIFSAVQGIGVMIGPTLGGFLSLQNSTATTVELSALILGLNAVFYLFYFLSEKVRT